MSAAATVSVDDASTPAAETGPVAGASVAPAGLSPFLGGLGAGVGRGAGFFAVSSMPLANSMTWP